MEDSILSRIRMITKYRDLLRIIVVSNLKEKYMGSVLGYFWSLLEPLLTMLVYLFVFSIVVRFKVENYPVFLLTGILSWNFFQMSTTTAVSSLTRNYNLIRKVKMPREIFPLADVISRMIEFILSLAVLFIFIIYYKINLTGNLVFFPCILILQFFFIYGINLFLSNLNVLFRDVQRLQSVFMRFWFYATPVIYPAAKVPESIRDIYMLNPMAVVVESYRAVLLGNSFPDFHYIIEAVAITALIYFSGIYFFIKNERVMLKFI
ncbi:MAG: ABC transporter permease [Candidatus Schekmanbacteria bacterium]|nr:MAG: ABC transporter permease [Candidatus Schekmanbacteria bacterium]